MSNITREELQRIFDTYHIVFLNIQKEAAKFNVDFGVDIDKDGRMKLSARDVSDDDVTRWYELSQDKDSIRYEETVIKKKG